MNVHLVLVELLLAEKRKEDQPKHVERSEPGGDKSEQPQRSIRMLCRFENFVLAEKSGESRDAGNRKRGDKHRPERHRDGFTQAAHLAHVLLAAHRVNHAPRAKEE